MQDERAPFNPRESRGDLPPPPPPPRGRGCLFWGCLIVAVLVLLVGSCIGVFVYGYFKFTSPAPKPVPVEQVAPDEGEAVEKRVAAFEEAAKKEAPARLELTAKEINTLIAASPRFKELRGKVYARLEIDRIILDLSVPVGKGQAERWFNGTVSLTFSLVNGEPRLAIESAETADKRQVPTAPLQVLIAPLLEDLRQEMEKAPGKIKSIEVRDGKLIVEH